MYDFSHRLDRPEYDPVDVSDPDFDAGWLAADANEAWTANGGIAIMDEDATGRYARLAKPQEAAGVREYWAAKGYARRK